MCSVLTSDSVVHNAKFELMSFIINSRDLICQPREDKIIVIATKGKRYFRLRLMDFAAVNLMWLLYMLI